MNITQEQLYAIVNLVDLHSRTTDQEISMKLKSLINNELDKINSGEQHELEN